MALVLCGVMVVWTVAVIIKAGTALQRGTPYVFSMWDGGAMRAGKKLTRLGTHMKIASVILMATTLSSLLIGAIPRRIGFPALLVVVALSIASDFLFAEKN